MDSAIVEILKGAGPAGVLAIIIFYAYRQLVKNLVNLIEKDQETREKHTTALTELITWLKARNGH